MQIKSFWNELLEYYQYLTTKPDAVNYAMKTKESSYQRKLDLGCHLNRFKLRTKIKGLILIATRF